MSEAEQIAVITGSGSGMGRASNLKLAEKGMKLVLVDFNEQTGEETLRLVKEQGGEGIIVKADVSKSEDVQNYPKTERKEVEAFYKESMFGATLELLATPRGSFRNAAAITFAVHTEKEGQPIRIDVTDVMTFDSNGKIATMNAYWGPDDIQQL